MSADIKITPITLPHATLAPLARAARIEGFAFLDRLVRDWNNATNRFDHAGECLLGAFNGATVLAIGGLNIDPYANDPRCGRLRHVYVRADHRAHGLGRRLLHAISRDAPQSFDKVRLQTSMPLAAAFYHRLGFISAGDPSATHELTLRGGPSLS